MFNPEWEKKHSRGYGNKYPSEEVMSFLSSRRPSNLLDIGCGTGYNMLWAAYHGVEVVGVDGSKSAIDEAKNVLSGYKHELHLFSLPAKLPFPDNSFDAAIDIECLYCLPIDDAAIMYKEIHRVLKPDGYLLLRAHTEGSWRQWEIMGDDTKYRSPEDMRLCLKDFKIKNAHILTRDYGECRAIKEWVIVAGKE